MIAQLVELVTYKLGREMSGVQSLDDVIYFSDVKKKVHKAVYFSLCISCIDCNE